MKSVNARAALRVCKKALFVVLLTTALCAALLAIMYLTSCIGGWWIENANDNASAFLSDSQYLAFIAIWGTLIVLMVVSFVAASVWAIASSAVEAFRNEKKGLQEDEGGVGR